MGFRIVFNYHTSHNIITISSITEFGRVGMRADIGSLKEILIMFLDSHTFKDYSNSILSSTLIIKKTFEILLLVIADSIKIDAPIIINHNLIVVNQFSQYDKVCKNQLESNFSSSNQFPQIHVEKHN